MNSTALRAKKTDKCEIIFINEAHEKFYYEKLKAVREYAVQHIEVYFNYIGKFENELTKQIEPTGQEMIQMREEIEEAKKEKSWKIFFSKSKEGLNGRKGKSTDQ